MKPSWMCCHWLGSWTGPLTSRPKKRSVSSRGRNELLREEGSNAESPIDWWPLETEIGRSQGRHLSTRVSLLRP